VGAAGTAAGGGASAAASGRTAAVFVRSARGDSGPRGPSSLLPLEPLSAGGRASPHVSPARCGGEPGVGDSGGGVRSRACPIAACEGARRAPVGRQRVREWLQERAKVREWLQGRSGVRTRESLLHLACSSRRCSYSLRARRAVRDATCPISTG